MTEISETFARSVADERSSAPRAQSPSHKTTRDCPRITLRFSPDDYARLQEMADGAALATYIRAVVLNQKRPRHSRRSRSAVVDKAGLAKLLSLLGQSRIASNLNQQAYHANTDTLVIDEGARREIAEAYDHVLRIRETLVQALGRSDR